MYQIKQSETTAARRRIPVLLVDSVDGYTPKTGQTAPTVTISKNGATAAAGTGTWAEISNGQYYYEFAAGEVDTLGWIAVNVQKTACRQYNAVVQVMAYDYAAVTNLGLTNLDVASSSRLASSSYTTPPTAATISNTVWTENLSSYNTNNTAGKILKDTSALNPGITGNTNNNITATTTTFSVDRNDATGTFNHQTIVFTSGQLTGVSSDIITWTKVGSYSVVVLGDPLPVAPTNNTPFYILPQHVQAITDIADGILNRMLDSSGDSLDVTNERTVRSALRAMRNKVSVSSGLMTVYKENDSTQAWSASLSNTADVTVDPT